jgi:hypothetical protein
MKKVCSYISVTLSCVLVLLIGCSKDKGLSSSSASNELLTDSLLLKLPTSAAGFAVFDLGGEGYKLFRASPFAKAANARDIFDGIQSKLQAAGASEEIIAISRKLFDACGTMGLVAADGTYTPEKVLRRTVFFAGPSTNENLPLDLGFFSQAAAGVDLLQKFKVLRGALQDAGLTTSLIAVAQGEGFSVPLKDLGLQLYFMANSTVFGVSLSQTTVEALLAKDNTATLSTLQNLPEYKRAVANLPQATQPLMFGFASLNRLDTLLEKIAKLDESGQFNPKELPVEALALQSSFAKEYVHNLGVAVTARTETQAKLLKAFEASTLPSSTAKLPTDTALALALDPRFLKTIDSLMNDLKTGSNPAVAEQIELVQGITVGLRNNTAGAPIPDVLMTLDSASRDSLNSALESSFTSLLSIVGQAASWQTKEIAGAPTRYFSTLIGAGVYISAPKGSNTLMLGTSEGIIRDLSASSSGANTSLFATLPAAIKGQDSSGKIALLYLNFVRIADVLDSIKSTLAMFTGGNSELNEILNAANIRSWGVAAGSVSYTPGALMLNASMNASAK